MKLAILCLMGISIAPFTASASTTDTQLQTKVISAIKAKRGYSDSVAVSIVSVAASGIPGFLTAELTIKDGQKTKSDSVSISTDGRFYTEAPLIPLKDGTESGILNVLGESLRESSSHIAITAATAWIHDGFRHGYVYSTVKGRPLRQDYYLANDNSALVLGDLYYLYEKKEVARIAATDAHIVLGSPDRRSVLVLFSDFQCPYCAELEKKINLPGLLKLYPGITIMLRDYPLSYHSWAHDAALADVCAYTAIPDKYLTYREEVFKRQEHLTAENARSQLIEIATGLGIDPKSFEECLGSGTASKAVEDDIRTGDVIQLSGTPAAFMDGRALPVNWTISDLHLTTEKRSGSRVPFCSAQSQPQTASCGDEGRP